MNVTTLENFHSTTPNLFSEAANPYAWLFAVVILTISYFYLLRSTSDGKLYDLGGFPILTAWTFFSRRYDFMRGNFERSGGLPFRFRVLQHRVVALTGPVARKEFFGNPKLHFEEGYRVLYGAEPDIQDVDADVDLEAAENRTEAIKRLLLLIRKERLADIIPTFMEDIHDKMLEWGPECMINPFKEVYDIVFQLTIRMSTCRELSRDKAAVEKMAGLYLALEKSVTPMAILLPWIPSPAKRMRKAATRELYSQVIKHVAARRAAGANTSDAIDILIQNGVSDPIITDTILVILFAGVLNTGIVACWVLLYLGLNPTWRQRAIAEIQSVTSRFCDPFSAEPLHKNLATIPPSAWEQDLPSVDLIIRETIRVSIAGTFLRRIVGKDVELQGVTIQKGDFLAYNASDVHMNEDIYADSKKWDPARFEAGREEDKKAHFGFVGWGIGRHPCLGTTLARLEIKIILSLILLGYHYDIVDETGVKTDYLPKPDWNDLHQGRTLGRPVFLKLSRTRD